MVGKAFYLLLGVPLLVTGLWAIGDAAGWYATVPGPSGTGPFNAHFVRDIGAAYAAAGGAVLWAGLRRDWAVPLLGTAGAFLALHALVHGGERLAGLHHGMHDGAAELALVWFPAVIVLAACYGLQRGWRSAPR